MSKVICTEELKQQILSEHEAGAAVRELFRRYVALGCGDPEPEASSQGQGGAETT